MNDERPIIRSTSGSQGTPTLEGNQRPYKSVFLSVFLDESSNALILDLFGMLFCNTRILQTVGFTVTH